MKKNQKGFTLVELIAVIALLAILSVLAVVAFTNIQQNARQAVDRANADRLASALNHANTVGTPVGNASARYTTRDNVEATRSNTDGGPVTFQITSGAPLNMNFHVAFETLEVGTAALNLLTFNQAEGIWLRVPPTN